MAKTTAAKPSSAVAGQKIDAALVREIATLFNDTDLTEIEVEKGDLRIRVSRQHIVMPTQAPQQTYLSVPPSYAVAAPALDAAPVVAVVAPDSADTLKSPMVGTVYLRPSPDSKPFIELGAHVTAGQKVLLVEAMKTFNDIVAHKSGAVSAILVEEGQPVEYGQALIVIS